MLAALGEDSYRELESTHSTTVLVEKKKKKGVKGGKNEGRERGEDLSVPWQGSKAEGRAFPGGSDGEDSVCNVGDLGSISGLGRSSGEGHGSPLQYSCLENSHGQRSLVSYTSWGWIPLSD